MDVSKAKLFRYDGKLQPTWFLGLTFMSKSRLAHIFFFILWKNVNRLNLDEKQKTKNLSNKFEVDEN